jgi:uncharacterized protein YggT (Ycf19 family)
MLFILSVVKALVEVAGISLIAQMIVGLFSPATRESNPIYQLFGVVTKPVNQFVRKITPKQIIDQHIPLVSFFLLLVLWLLVTAFKIFEKFGSALPA